VPDVQEESIAYWPTVYSYLRQTKKIESSDIYGNFLLLNLLIYFIGRQNLNGKCLKRLTIQCRLAAYYLVF